MFNNFVRPSWYDSECSFCKDFDMCVEWMTDNGIQPDAWKQTYKSLIYYKDGKKHIVAKTKMRGYSE